MYRYRSFFIVITTLCIVTIRPAVGELLPELYTGNLLTLVQQAYDNNHSLKSMENKIAAIKAKSVFDGALTDPKIGVALSNVPSDDFKLDKEPMTQKQIFISQQFPWPGKRGYKQTITIIEAEILHEEMKKKKLSLARKIATNYYELGYISRALETNTRLKNRLTKVKNVANAVYRSGKGRQHSLFQAEVELGKLQEEKTALLNKITTKKIKINELINSKTYIDVQPPALPGFQKVRLDADALTARALISNPDVKTIKQLQKQSDIKIALAKKAYLPDTTVKVSYGQREGDRSDFVSASVTLNIPLFKRSRQDRQLEFTQKSKASVDDTFQFVTTTLPYRIESLVDQIHKLCDQHLLYQNVIIPQAEKWSESSMNDYKVGKIDFNTMIEANIKEIKYKLKKEKYQFDILIKAALLSELTGELL